MKKAIFLDRDGVINQVVMREGKPYPPSSLETLSILEGVPEALHLLKKAGFLLIVVTNQPDVGRKTQKQEVVEAIHSHLMQALPLDRIEVCYDERSPRYKPLPGMLLDAASQLQIDLSNSYMIGDRWRDIGAGKAAGCHTLLIDHHYHEPLTEKPEAAFSSLLEAAFFILSQHNSENPMLQNYTTKIFADGADLKGIEEMNKKPWVQGFTTNPTLKRLAGVKDYKSFAEQALAIVRDKPISFEVFADDFSEMEEQAHEIASWGKNIYVKIPIMNTQKIPAYPLIARLSQAGIPLNITAIFTVEQVDQLLVHLDRKVPSIISIFAGRIADTARDPVPIMQQALKKMRSHPKSELLWASPREIFNFVQANEIGCHIITLSNDLIKKIPLFDKDLTQYSLETVQMFFRDAVASEYSIACKCKSTL